MNFRVYVLVLFTVTAALLLSCENTYRVDSHTATLKTILVLSRPVDSSENDGYTSLVLTPEFHPESTSYSITIDTLSILGIILAPAFSETACSVRLDGEELSSTAWSNADSVFQCEYESGKNDRTLEINVTTDDDDEVRKYTVEVHFDGNGVSNGQTDDTTDITEGIGDFAPLAVGNEWVYSFERIKSVDIHVANWDEIKELKITITDITSSSDTVYYHGKIKESGKTYPSYYRTCGNDSSCNSLLETATKFIDTTTYFTLYEFNHEIFNSYKILLYFPKIGIDSIPIFYKHEIRKDETYLTQDSYNYSFAPTYKAELDSFSSNIWSYSDTYRANIGLIHLDHYYHFYKTYDNTTIKLISFNGESFNDDLIIE